MNWLRSHMSPLIDWLVQFGIGGVVAFGVFVLFETVFSKRRSSRG